jgi:checkpoint serine/threonine-protein kinase
VELLRTVEALHSVGFIHGDLKIDNVLVRLADVPGGTKTWAAKYRADGEGGWRHKGATLIDFGRCVDVNAFGPGTRFRAEWEVDATRDCPEMVRGESWTYEPDYHGLAGVAHTLLFGRRLVTSLDADTGRLGLERGALKRYHQSALWTSLFDALLNPRSVRDDGALPITAELAQLRASMEAWLTENADKAGRPSLKALLKKLEIASLSS